MAWSIKTADTALLLGERTAIELARNGKSVDPSALPAGVTLTPSAGGEVLGGDLVLKADPHEPEVTITVEEGSDKASATVKVLLPWTAAGPRTVDTFPQHPDATSWDDPKGRRARLVLHDLLEQLPSAFVRELDDLPIVRRPITDVAGMYENYPLRLEHIYVSEDDLKGLDPSLPLGSEADCSFATLLVHEMAHAFITRRCGGLQEGVSKGIQHLNELLLGVTVGVTTWATLLCPPVFAFAALVGGSFSLLPRQIYDEMSEYGEKSGWEQRDLSAMAFPLIGALFYWNTYEPPNIATSFLPQIGVLEFLVDVRNRKFNIHEVWKAASSPGKYWDKKSAVVPLVAGAGLANPYGAASPMEDFAEATTVLALRKRGPGGSDTLETPKKRDALYEMPSAERQKWFFGRGLFAPGDPDIVVGQSALGQKLKTPNWTLEPAPPSPEALARAGEASSFQSLLASVFKNWIMGPQKAVERAQQATVKVAAQADASKPFSVLAALEGHGDGLRRYQGKGQEMGDLVVARDQRMYVVGAVDAEGVPNALIGDPQATTPTGKRVKRDELQLRYQWPPDETPRRFSSGSPAPAYPDIEKNLRRLIGWWGETESEEQELDSLEGFFQGFARELKLALPKSASCKRTAANEALAQLNGLGEGLRPYEPAVPLQVGDVVIGFDENTLGVVTRINGAGQPVDLLVGGSAPEGDLGEKAGAVRMQHDVDHLGLRYVWRPDATPRTFSMGKTSPTSLTDPQRSLRHLLSHQGAQFLVRREDQVFFHDALGVFAGLLVEGEPQSEVRRRLGLSVRSTDEDVLNYLVAHGQVRARGEVMAGDLVLLDGGMPAVVLEAAGGTASQWMRVEDDLLAVSHEPVAAGRVSLAWALSTEPRVEKPPPGVDAFYGSKGHQGLLGLPGSIGGAHKFAVGLDGERQDEILHMPASFARVLASRAPVWVRRRLWGASDLEDVMLRCDTLGEGLTDGKEGKIPVGAWLFEEDGLNVVMATDTQGRPALVYAAGSNGGVRLYVHGGNVQGKVWVPSVEPRRYTEPESPGYVDRNRLVGMLHVWGERKFRIDTPLFCDADFVACGAFTDKVARLLQRGPSSADEWPDYLAGNGKLEEGPGKPGDLLLFSDAERQGVLLDDETMLVLPGPNKNVGLRKVAGVKGHWRPRD